MASLRDHSRKTYTERSENGNATEGEINAGSLQRIADATEIMAGNFIALQNDRDLYKRWYNEQRAAGSNTKTS